MIKYFNAFLPLTLQFFAAEGETETPETNPDGQSSAETKVKSSESADIPQEKTLTQAEFEEALKKRLERERKKFDGFDDMKTKLAVYEFEEEERRKAELTETERSQELAKQFEEEKNALTAQLEALREQSKQERIRNEFTKVASSANIVYIDDAIALADLSKVSIDDDGKVIGMDDVIKSLVENKPFLVAKKQTQPIGTATNGGQQSVEKTADQLLSEAAEKARQTGSLKDKAAYAQLKKQLGK